MGEGLSHEPWLPALAQTNQPTAKFLNGAVKPNLCFSFSIFSKCAADNSPSGPALTAYENGNPNTALGMTPLGKQSGTPHTLGHKHYVHGQARLVRLVFHSCQGEPTDGCLRGTTEALGFPPRTPIKDGFSPSNTCSDRNAEIGLESANLEL